MPKTYIVRAVAWVLTCLSLGSAAYAAESGPQTFNISPQPLSSALSEFARQSQQELLFTPEVVAEKKSNGVQGTLPPLDALSTLLKNTGISFSTTPNGAILLRSKDSIASSSPSLPSDQPIHLAQSNSGNTDSSNNQTSSDKKDKSADSEVSENRNQRIEEVIVTAQKRSERLQDVPVPVSVLNTSELTQNNQVRIRDYYSTVPGFSVAPDIESNQTLSIRGVTTGGLTTPTVGVVIDDVPFGASNVQGSEVPDFDPGDLARIEILRGPQGTLYGADSMGGLVKFVTIDPSTEGYSGRVEAGTSSVYNGAELGYTMRASTNVPLSDTFALRVSGFTRQDPGYIDNPVLHIDGINQAQAYGWHLATLWSPSDVVSLKVSALYQSIKGDGLSEVEIEPGLSGLQQNYPKGVGAYRNTAQAYSATLKAKLGSVEFTSISGYNSKRVTDSLDFSPYDGICAPGSTACAQALYGVSGAPLNDFYGVDKFSQELRLAGSLTPSVDWQVGGFFTHEHQSSHQTVTAENPVTGDVVAQLIDYEEPDTFQEYAGFFDLTYRFTDRFDVQVGGRQSQFKETFQLSQIGLPLFVGGPSPQIGPVTFTNSNVFTYLLTPRLKISPDLMVYARLASGYRPGSSNNVGLTPGAPPQSNPDKTENYEIGVKGDFLDHTLSVDASVYYIDWQNIQIGLYASNGGGYNANGSAAKSEGVELSVTSRPLTGLTIEAWAAYDDAVLTKPFPTSGSAYGVPGNKLPNTPRFSGNVSVEQNFPLNDRITGFVGAQASYVGEREGVFTGAPGIPAPRQSYPDYTKTDLRAGMKVDSWTANIFVNNVANVRGLLNGGVGYFIPQAYIYIPPRTVGLNVSKVF